MKIKGPTFGQVEGFVWFFFCLEPRWEFPFKALIQIFSSHSGFFFFLPTSTQLGSKNVYPISTMKKKKPKSHSIIFWNLSNLVLNGVPCLVTSLKSSTVKKNE